ncbi:serine-type D-Ala-D-Ala carboxypeptidase [Rubrobacter xylanophilus]|uniref:serine-type D-Ala-D-Ala carboxypeptidase n=1 Tax=Rubrobacter xylanophilus TaxID=49319 RepID=A0A510HK38_9ACTN|nr:D-alanyl-D-alanine carboxypeptidase family protein [Rubrobacter xylanophilus]BBL79655.1 serine-type D-Ala-D-Ala carboxypeptidase [Rubrobacter xylanophilus]
MLQRAWLPKHLLVALVAAVTPLLSQLWAAPAAWAQPSGVRAEAWALADLRSGEVLAAHDAGERLPMASTTKIMLALVALREGDLDREVVVSPEAAAYAAPPYSNVGLRAGDVLSVRELLMASLISSGDDAAYALAEALGEGSVERFVEEMNRVARRLGLEDTRFRNPVGLDDGGHRSSARDLVVMSRAAMQYPLFREIVATEYAVISTQDREIPLANTNELLFTYPPATGIKTGTTPEAGPCLVASAASGDESYVAVVLDARADRFAASVELLEYGFSAYDRRELVRRGERYASVEVPYRRGERVPLVAGESVEGLLGPGSEVRREVEVDDELPGAARRGDRLGRIVVWVDGERAGSAPLVAARGYEEASLWEKLWYTVEGFFSDQPQAGGEEGG